MAESWAVDGIGKWIAYDRGSGALVGRGGASRTMITGTESIEVGWAIRHALWGRGYATEIGAAGLRFVDDVLGSEKVVSFTEVHNTRSRAVMERLGMSFVSEIQAPGLVEGEEGIRNDARFALYTLIRSMTGAQTLAWPVMLFR